jgi:hypothetical protein
MLPRTVGDDCTRLQLWVCNKFTRRGGLYIIAEGFSPGLYNNCTAKRLYTIAQGFSPGLARNLSALKVAADGCAQGDERRLQPL